MASQLTKTTNGLLGRLDFRSQAGLTLGQGWSLDNAVPVMCCSVRSPYSPLEVTNFAGTTVAGGLRESQVIYDRDGSMLAFVGAGDGTGNTALSAADPSNLGSVWRPQLISLPTLGAGTPAVIGDMGIGLYKDPSNHGAGTWAALDFLNVDDFDGYYYLHVLTTQSANELGNNGYVGGVPGESYSSAVFKSPAATLASAGGTWALSLATATGGSGSGIGATDFYLSAANLIAGSWQAKFSVVDGSNPRVYQIGTGSGGVAPDGPYTLSATALLPAGLLERPENIKDFFHPALGAWVAPCCEITTPQGVSLFVSPEYADYSQAKNVSIQRPCPADGFTLIGICSPFKDFRDRAVVIDEHGYVPVVYDTDPIDTQSGHNGRSCHFATLMPAPAALHYLPGGSANILDETWSGPGGTVDGYDNWVLSSSAGGGGTYASGSASLGSAPGPTWFCNTTGGPIANPTVSAPNSSIAAYNCSIGLSFSVVDAANPGNACYTVDINANSPTTLAILLYQFSGGNATIVGAQVNYSGIANYGATFTPRVEVDGSMVTVLIDGVAAGSWTTSAAVPGGYTGARNGGGGTGLRQIGGFVVSGDSGQIQAAATAATYPLTYTNVISEHFCEFPDLATAAGSYQAIRLGVQASGDCYEIRLDGSGAAILSLWKSSGGSGGTPGAFAQLSAGSVAPSSGATYGSLTAVANFLHRVKAGLAVAGSTATITAYLDGQQQLNYADSSAAYTAGAAVGFAGSGVESIVRLAQFRASDVVTIGGLASGASVVVRAPGIPEGGHVLEKGTATGPSYATSTLGSYPASSVDIDGVNFPIAGYLWGGDVLEYSTGASGAIPAAGDVRLGTPTGATVGTLAVPAAAQVLSGVEIDATIGTVALPSPGQVEAGVTYGPGSGVTGTYAGPGGTFPTAAQVLAGVSFGPADNIEGTIVLPQAGQVEQGIAYGPGSNLTGTLASSGGAVGFDPDTVIFPATANGGPNGSATPAITFRQCMRPILAMATGTIELANGLVTFADPLTNMSVSSFTVNSSTGGRDLQSVNWGT